MSRVGIEPRQRGNPVLRRDAGGRHHSRLFEGHGHGGGPHGIDTGVEKYVSAACTRYSTYHVGKDGYRTSLWWIARGIGLGVECTRKGLPTMVSKRIRLGLWSASLGGGPVSYDVHNFVENHFTAAIQGGECLRLCESMH